MKDNQLGFGTVEIILVVIIIALVGVVGWLAYKNHHKSVPTTSTSNIANSTTSTNAPIKTKTTTADPYVGWGQYCDTEGKICFKYPSDWTQSENKQALSSTANNISTTVQSPTQSVNISYDYPYVRDASNTNFLVMSIDNIPNQPNLKIVGGIYTETNNFAQYSVVDASAVMQAGLVVGQNSQFINTPRFGLTSDTNNEPYQFVAIDGEGNGNNTLVAAKSWFSSADAKKGLLILQSLTTQ
jgi:hypothetical protein